ncbi:LacI family DNA-binding transcriptional regulator [Halothermothrix orenii]|uniref:Transcriptional regulator, LacI family n=1 Tax=Halothermothrix orenii (strain H 168 / OCM 544 / DSM 9562) TaxID=373903 RepID=B8D048_HALOH|nr:LacI family DNA-binding transcriptional regulator [Halothermothrix orenii]ACL68802.1 transcriptional regulator, LacI family [Halothermothrix orenii H 168]
MSVTIKDIAKRLGVSATAVSKALNDRDDVSEELKRKVLKVAEELDYSANTIAKRLVTNKSNTIGVFMLSRRESEQRETVGFQFLSGILEEANKNGYDIVLFSTNSDLLDEKSYIKLCKERRVEGAIFTGLRLDDPHIPEIKKAKFPITIIDTELDDAENVGFITTDNLSGVHKALEYLWKLGHRRIAMINGHHQAQVSKRRYQAFKEFLTQKGVFDEDLVFYGDFTKNSGYKAALKILELNEPPTAVFSASDLMALGAIKAFKDKGLILPRDMSIIGYDNITSSEYTDPSLTTVAQDSVNMGREAVRLVLDGLDGGTMKKKVLEAKLVIRDSCARCC